MNTGTRTALAPALALDARVPRASEILHSLNAGEITLVMIARLARQRDLERGLPPCQRDEDPAAIFIDVIKGTRDVAFAERLRFACLQALRKVNSEAAPAPDVWGDLCYLAAAIAAVETLDILPAIVAAERSDKILLLDGEAVRSRALRALIGLLAVQPRRSPELEELFKRLLRDPPYRILALTGLIGLWPARRQEFLAMVPAHQIDEQRLNVSLDLIGFGSSTTVAAH